jgi:hypothetical protein
MSREDELRREMHSAKDPGAPGATPNDRASAILTEFEQAETELFGKAVVLTDGKAGTVEKVWLDELHGLRVSIKGQDGKWPVSTIKLTQS